jgi:hypothetical protein
MERATLHFETQVIFRAGLEVSGACESPVKRSSAVFDSAPYPGCPKTRQKPRD